MHIKSWLKLDKKNLGLTNSEVYGLTYGYFSTERAPFLDPLDDVIYGCPLSSKGFGNKYHNHHSGRARVVIGKRRI